MDSIVFTKAMNGVMAVEECVDEYGDVRTDVLLFTDQDDFNHFVDYCFSECFNTEEDDDDEESEGIAEIMAAILAAKEACDD